MISHWREVTSSRRFFSPGRYTMLVAMTILQRRKACWKRRALATSDHEVDWRFVHPLAVMLLQMLQACNSGSVRGARREK